MAVIAANDFCLMLNTSIWDDLWVQIESGECVHSSQV